MNLLHDRCILTRELSEKSGAAALFITLPHARCAGNPPDDPLELCPLCLDCDLFHRQGNRNLFTKLSACLAESHADVISQRTSQNIGCSAMRHMLERLLLGDPDIRIVLPEDIGIFRDLEPLLNRMADYMKNQIDDSHEFAIGMCEHYETLLKLANGDLESRASTSSPIEVIAKLGELINLQVDAFLRAVKGLNTKEQELISQTELLKGIIDFLPDATFVVDNDQRVIAWNKAMEELSGVSEAEILGKGDHAYSFAFYGEKRPLLIDLIGADLDTMRRYYGKVEMRGSTLIAEGSIPGTLHGSARDLWITASPLFDQNRRVVGSIESVRDITDFKNAESERELLKDQLHHAQKLDSIGQLAGGIAHEFNNILAAILGYAGILEKRLGSDSPNLPAVHRIISASEKASSLTRGMLAFSRKQVVVLQPISLSGFICGMKEMLCRLAGENFQIEFHLDSAELNLSADIGQLQQIMLNLYNNARDAMPDGGRLTITTSGCRLFGNEADILPGMPPGNYVKMTVADTGHGIRPEEMNRIFDPFFTTKEVGKGTGLGLSIVFGIVQQHSGFIKVDSTPGQGTTFSIWFPEYECEKSSYPTGTSGREAQCEAPGGETILVGEDDDDVRPMIVELLQDRGYQVLEACDGTEVVALMKRYGATVDLLLLDVVMPRMSGNKALSVVRESYPELPCVFLSGYSDDLLRQKVNISGAFEYLSKPIMPDMLIATVRAALNEKSKGI